MQKTHDLKIENARIRKEITDFQKFIQNSLELSKTFSECFIENQEILLHPPKRDQAPVVQHPIAEEWEIAMLENSYLLCQNAYQGLSREKSTFLRSC